MNYTEFDITKFDITKITSDDVKNILIGYFSEVLEVLVIYGIYTYLANNIKFDIVRTLKIAFVIGLITFISESYNPMFKKNMKAGILSSIGTGMIKSF